jgi:hypothetical protein
MAKVLSYSNSNPKMGATSVPVKGYKDGGIVGQEARPNFRVPPQGVQGRSVQLPRPATPAPSAAKTGLEYDAYDTTMEEFAKAPTVGYGEAARTTAMPDIAKPTDVKYYGEEFKGEAEKLSTDRWNAYNRRMANAAIRTGNVLPGETKSDPIYSKVPALTQKAVQLALPKLSEKAAMPKAASSSLTMDSLVKTATMLTPKSTLLYASDMIEYAKQRKKK